MYCDRAAKWTAHGSKMSSLGIEYKSAPTFWETMQITPESNSACRYGVTALLQCWRGAHMTTDPPDITPASP
jgi:hypothetical protein